MDLYAPFTQHGDNRDSLPYVPQPPMSSNQQIQSGGSNGGWHIVPQTKIAFIGFLLLVITMVVVMLQNPQAGSLHIMTLLVNVAVFLVALYVINCIVLGKCNLYAWIISYVAVVLGVVSIVSLILALSR